MINDVDVALLRAHVLQVELPRELRDAADRIVALVEPAQRDLLRRTILEELGVACARAEFSFARRALAAAMQPAATQ